MNLIHMCNCSAVDGGDGERVTESVGVLEGEGAAVGEGLAVVDDAVVVAKALEDAGVDEAGGAEPATGEVDAGDIAAVDAHVHDLHRVRGYAAGQGGGGALVDHDIRL
ncbi:hypothetical protein RJ639_004386 [Escallonia herrerae]|uniref:Uncharacterized protein n=1 Tax=Escallonia herrerae TaxID=1293975 RepID=A0AA88W0Y9_9ASTE|nr:hypothetical protein RJ639_004386 [Escallonia herrerae]